MNDGNGVAWRGLEQELALLDDPKRAGLSKMITHALNYADEIGADRTKLELSTVLGAFPEMVAARGAEAIDTFLESQADGGPV